MTAEEIANKISSSPHQEFNLDKFKNIEQIKSKINNLEDLYESDKKFEKNSNEQYIFTRVYFA